MASSSLKHFRVTDTTFYSTYNGRNAFGAPGTYRQEMTSAVGLSISTSCWSSLNSFRRFFVFQKFFEVFQFNWILLRDHILGVIGATTEKFPSYCLNLRKAFLSAYLRLLSDVPYTCPWRSVLRRRDSEEKTKKAQKKTVESVDVARASGRGNSTHLDELGRRQYDLFIYRLKAFCYWWIWISPFFMRCRHVPSQLCLRYRADVWFEAL